MDGYVAIYLSDLPNSLPFLPQHQLLVLGFVENAAPVIPGNIQYPLAFNS
jgi:hypothetical protein